MPKKREGFGVPEDERLGIVGHNEQPADRETSKQERSGLDALARQALMLESERTPNVDEAIRIAKGLGCDNVLFDNEKEEYSFYATPIEEGDLWSTWHMDKGWSAELFGRSDLSKGTEDLWAYSLEVAIRRLMQRKEESEQ